MTRKYILDNERLKKEWDFEKNLNLDPKTVTLGSHKKAWWICELGHSWEAEVKSHANDSNCPYCSGRLPIVGETDLVSPENNFNCE